MANLKAQREIKLIDESNSKGVSRVYRKHATTQVKSHFYKEEENKKLVHEYIFGTGDYPEALKEMQSDKVPPIADNGMYIYTEEEIKKHGTPKGAYYLSTEDGLIEQG